MELINQVIRNVANIPGWSTRRKLLVIESDDWGSIRMRSLQDKKAMEQKGFDFKNQPFNRFDALESNDDLSSLLEVLSRHKDRQGRFAVLTALMNVANPDFEAIERSDFQSYHYEPFTETLRRYPNHHRVFEIYSEAQRSKLISLEFHGREHLNYQRWMRRLQEGNKSLHMAFQHGVTGVHLGIHGESLGDMQAAFDPELASDLFGMASSLSDGLDLFNRLWNRRARYFVPTNGPFNLLFDQTLKANGIEFIHRERLHRDVFADGETQLNLRFNYLGRKNGYGQYLFLRNAFFEPFENKDALSGALLGIERAFRWGKPAILLTHRVNYIGSIEESNRTSGLRQLDCLLSEILKRWPDVEFISSSELGDLIVESKR